MKLELEKKLPFVATPNVVRILDTVLLQRFQILLFVVTSEWTEKEIDASEPVIPGFFMIPLFVLMLSSPLSLFSILI